MYTLNRTSAARATNIWPAFVDGLATLILVFIFVLLFFTFAQFFLSLSLTDKERELTILDRRLSELSELLQLEQQSNEELRRTTATLQEELRATLAERDDLSAELASLRSSASLLQDDLSASRAGYDALEAEVVDLRERLAESDSKRELLEALRLRLEDELTRTTASLESERAITEDQERTVTLLSEDNERLAREATLLNAQLREIRAQLAALEEALDASEAKNKAQQVEILTLGNRLNAALAGKVQELADYRSEFFGRLREVLGDNPNLRIVGDRFIFQSEVLFSSGSADIAPEGRARINRLAEVLRDIASRIPEDVNWILRIDGHTDKNPIATARFPSNWELSAARAIAVVRALEEEGIPSSRMAATGFGEHQPILLGDSAAELARNRRIEFKLTER